MDNCVEDMLMTGWILSTPSDIIIWEGEGLGSRDWKVKKNLMDEERNQVHINDC